MYSLKPGLVIGFHGCEESVRDDIVSGRMSMRPSENTHDWLGKGFYFWENNFKRALDFLHGMRVEDNLEGFDSARGVFIEGEELYPGAGFKNKNHIQLCIRNPNCIKGFFIPRKEVKWL